MNILVLGGTGFFGRMVARRLRERAPGHRVAIAGRDLERTRRVASRIADGVEAVAAAWTDHDALRESMRGYDLVLNLAAPYTATLEPALSAAIDAGVNYCDILGEGLMAEAALRMDARAHAAGVTACFGMGHFPGLTNLLAKHAIQQLDEPRAVDVGVAMAPWAFGDLAQFADQMEKAGRATAAMLAMLEGMVGPFPVVRDGRRVLCDVRTPAFPVDWPGGGVESVYLVDSLEQVTLKARFPELCEVRHLSSMIVPRVDEIYRDFAKRVFDGELELLEALVAALRAMGADADSIPGGFEIPPRTLWARASGKRRGRETRVTCHPTGTWAESSQLQPTIEILCSAALRLLEDTALQPGVSAPEMLFDLPWLLEDVAAAMDLGDPESLVEIEVEER